MAGRIFLLSTAITVGLFLSKAMGTAVDRTEETPSARNTPAPRREEAASSPVNGEQGRVDPHRLAEAINGAACSAAGRMLQERGIPLPGILDGNGEGIVRSAASVITLPCGSDLCLVRVGLRDAIGWHGLLLFERAADAWRCVKHQDVGGWHGVGDAALHTCETGHAFLAFEYCEGKGTGTLLKREVWFRIDRGHFVPVLDHYSNGYLSLFYDATEFSMTLNELSVHQGRPRVVFTWTVRRQRYSEETERTHLVSKTDTKVVYDWNPKTGRFESRSPLPPLPPHPNQMDGSTNAPRNKQQSRSKGVSQLNIANRARLDAGIIV